MTDGTTEDSLGAAGAPLPVAQFSAALGVHVLKRAPSGAPCAWELQLWPARLDEVARWLRLPPETPVWRAPTGTRPAAEAHHWDGIQQHEGELLDGIPASQAGLPEPFLLAPEAALAAADRIALSVQDGAHAVLWTHDRDLLLAAVRGFVTARTAPRPHPQLLAELVAPLPLGHAWRLHTSAQRQAVLEIELVGGEADMRCAWTASATGVWVPQDCSASGAPGGRAGAGAGRP